MRKRLQIALMASTVPRPLSFSHFNFAPPTATEIPSKITTSDEHGRTIYVNGSAPTLRSPRCNVRISETNLDVLELTKIIDGSRCLRPNAAAMRAARSAAAEVSHILDGNRTNRRTPKLWQPIFTDGARG